TGAADRALVELDIETPPRRILSEGVPAGGRSGRALPKRVFGKARESRIVSAGFSECQRKMRRAVSEVRRREGTRASRARRPEEGRSGRTRPSRGTGAW